MNLFRKENHKIWFTLSFFLLLFSLISIPNHYCFRTSALDYGMFNQALWTYSVGEKALFTQGVEGAEVNYLCDHFSPIIILLSPFRYIFGTYTLLVAQIVAILVGAFSIRRIALLRGLNENLSLGCSIFFLSIWGVFGALSFEFHTNVIAASLLPLLYLFLLRKNYVSLGITFFLALLCKENSALLLMFFFVVVALEKALEKKSRWISVALSITSVIWLLLVLLVIMPGQCDGHRPNVEGFYNAFGNSFSEAIQNMISSPGRVFVLLYENFDGGIAKSKITTYWFLLLSGGIFIVLNPKYLLLLLPILFQKFLSSNDLLWDVNGHYSIEFAPAIVLAAIGFLSGVKVTRMKNWMLYTSIGLALFISWRGVISRTVNANFFRKEHYQSKLIYGEFNVVASQIPEDAVITCSSNLSPHMSFRSRVFVFPVFEESEYILLWKDPITTYPMKRSEYENALKGFQYNEGIQLLEETEHLLLFKRN